MKQVLFVCSHNAGRSQMAEAILNHRARDGVRALSAGTDPAEQINPAVVEALREIGIRADGLQPKPLTQEMLDTADLTITLGCGASECCASLLQSPRENWDLEDPAGQPLEKVRQVRDEISARVNRLLARLEEEEAESKRAVVRETYGAVARGGGSCCGPSACCGGSGASPSEQMGYSPSDLSALPEGADLGLGCGNPVGLGSLREGEVVLDLGSGAGIDCFLAARRVGPKGHVIGVDMTPEMLRRARANAVKSGLSNVEFRLGEIEHLPVETASVDVVISNCVLNLVPDKAQAFREIARVLKPGGRITVSDIVKLRELPEELADDPNLYSACVAGAVSLEEYLGFASAAGLEQLEVLSERDATELLAQGSDPTARLLESLPEEKRHGLAASITLRGVKPAVC